MPVAAKKTKAITKKSTAAKKVEATPQPAAVEQPVVAQPVVAQPVAAAAQSTPKVHLSFEELMDQCVKQAQTQVVTNRGLVSSIREARKCHDREMREAMKNTKRSRKQADGTKKPLTGFAKPCRISDELADFLHDVAGNADVSRGIEMSRTEVTRRLNEYFVKNDLRDVQDKRTILYEKDPKLVALFGGNVPKGQKLTYFNLQSALKDKFIKPTPTVQQTATTQQTTA